MTSTKNHEVIAYTMSRCLAEYGIHLSFCWGKSAVAVVGDNDWLLSLTLCVSFGWILQELIYFCGVVQFSSLSSVELSIFTSFPDHLDGTLILCKLRMLQHGRPVPLSVAISNSWLDDFTIIEFDYSFIHLSQE